MFNCFLLRIHVWVEPLKRLIITAWRELAGTLICASTYGLCLWLQMFWPQAPIWLYLLANGLCLFCLYPLCWKAPHPWPVSAAGCVLMAVMADILALIHPQISRLTLVLVIDLTGVALLASLAIAAFTVWRSRKKPAEIGIFSYE